jgi:glycosyltransferase involved in cell wall biosynthesis
MKLVVFAHTPPPFHGQSYMVELMIDGLRRSSESGVQLFHVDSKLSPNLEAIAKFKWSKLFLILKYCAQAYFHRFAHGADHLYYVPAPGLRAALYRDWIVMFLCRPIFKKIIFHWHAVGLGEWLEKTARPWERKISRWLLGNVDLSIVLSEFGRTDAMRFSPRKIEVIANGIPDPCPNFEKSILPDRRERFRARCTDEHAAPFTVVFVGACTAAKGLFVTLDAIALSNQRLVERNDSIFARLIVAGDFISSQEQAQFLDRILQPDLSGVTATGESEQLVIYKGFVAAEEKNQLFRQADCLCFPTNYLAEGQPLTILEAFAFGLSVVATCWRGIPDLLGGSESRLIDSQDPAVIADALEDLMKLEAATVNREIFLDRYRVDKFIARLTDTLVRI